MVQWADILTALHMLGHNLKMSVSLKELHGWVWVRRQLFLELREETSPVYWWCCVLKIVLSQSRSFYLKISTIDCQAILFSLFCLSVGSRKRWRTRSVDCRLLVSGAKTELPGLSHYAHTHTCYQVLHASAAAGRRWGHRQLETLWTFRPLTGFGTKKGRRGGKGGALGAPPSDWAIIYPLIGVAAYWMAAVPGLLGSLSQGFQRDAVEHKQRKRLGLTHV